MKITGYAKKKTIIFAALFAAAVFITACAVSEKSSMQKYPVTRVSVILPHNDDGYWSFIREGIEEAEAEIGKEYNIDIRIFVPQLNYNIAQMTDLLSRQTAAQTDVVIMQGNEDPEFLNVLNEAHEQGIKIICIDTAIKDFPYDLYIGTDNKAAGRLIGEKVAELTGGEAKVAVISGEEGYLNLDERMEGFREVLSGFPGIEITETGYDKYDGLTFMNLYHSFSENADTLVCLEGTGGQTLSQSYSERDESYRYAVGFDAYPGVGSGVLDGIVKQDTNRMGRLAVEEIARYIENGHYSADAIYTDIYWLTEENSDEAAR